MGKKLAIKGHLTRGKEVIEILEMMGGTNPFSINDGIVIGNKTTNCYYISEDTASKYISWDYIGPEEIDRYKIFTLEEFLKEYPHKIGDKVVDCYGDSRTIKSMGWLEDLETMVYAFEENSVVLAAKDIRFAYDAEFLINKEKSEEVGKMLCDTTLNNLHRISLKNVLSELYEHIKSTPKEELEREFKEIESEGWTNVGPTVEEFMDFCNKVNKKPKYPKTFKECRAILNYMVGSMSGYKASLLASLQDLLVCRDAYWKIAGEEMGLNGPWEPDWNDSTPKYTIIVIGNELVKHYTFAQNFILAFPTEEMREAFYENFKDLIEQCKDLL